MKLYEKAEGSREMSRMDMVLYYIKELFDINLVLVFVGIGLFLLLRDVPLLKKRNMDKEGTIAKVLAYLYILGSLALFIVGKIV